MTSNIDKYKKDLEMLISQATNLEYAIIHASFPNKIVDEYGEESKSIIENLPDFVREYQAWYSESLALIKQLLPDRLSDFIRLFEKPKGRKALNVENYRIEDFLHGLELREDIFEENGVGRHCAIPHFQQQSAILKAVSRRFESTLFDIKQLVQADVFDTELESARELIKKGIFKS